VVGSVADVDCEVIEAVVEAIAVEVEATDVILLDLA